jgi:hypothetical protein
VSGGERNRGSGEREGGKKGREKVRPYLISQVWPVEARLVEVATISCPEFQLLHHIIAHLVGGTFQEQQTRGSGLMTATRWDLG